MSTLDLLSVGWIAPGFESWDSAICVLRNERVYESAATQIPTPDLLPANERRRATPSVRLAFAAAAQAVRRLEVTASELATVFASSEGDTGILHRLCSALAESAPLLSPTDFHNSVHNAAAGYWSIATHAKAPSVSVSGYDSTFIAGLLEAYTWVLSEQKPVLLVCYDMQPPELLRTARPIVGDAAVALVLAPQGSRQALASLSLTRTIDVETPMCQPELERLRLSHPAARALPLLKVLALRLSGRVVLHGAGASHWALTVTAAA